MMSRARRTLVGEWWWTVDRMLLAAVVALMGAGIVLSLAASPPVAHRLGYDTFHFVNRQAAYMIPALVVLISVSLMTPRQIRRLGVLVLLVTLAMTAATLVIGVEVKGARRWLNLAGLSIQPSEFLKPAFVLISAWLFSESQRRPEMPATLLAFGLMVLSAGLLILQPDFGQTMLIVLVWASLFFMAGVRWIWVVGMMGAAVAGIFGAYTLLPHVAKRINKFLNPEAHDTFQVQTAIESFLRGGWLGKGPGEGTVKRVLPDSHTDFIFAVVAEEFGIIMCLAIAGLFAFVVVRALSNAMRDEDPFTRFATCGLTVLFGLQSCINMMVNLQLMPAKGMTLPFISYGGSSLISLAYGMGMVLALTRKRPQAELQAHLDPMAQPA